MKQLLLLVAWSVLSSISRGAEPPLVVTGDEQSQIDMALPDGGLPAAPGVANIQVFRASRAAPQLADGKGWTYHHHVDLGCWKGLLYLAWDSCEKDEDVWPSRELYSTSTDGTHWSNPAELFPPGVSTHLRMFFFHAPNGRMLTITGLRMSHEQLTERKKGPLIVREILADHALGPVYLLRPPVETKADAPPMFDTAPDATFVEACNQLLANKPFLEQSDFGMLLGERRMKWHDVNTWPADEPSRAYFGIRFGKAMAFYHRKDGALVAMMKFGWVLVSHDRGETWSSPVRPSTLVSGMAKTWGQRTADGRFLLAYNPSLTERFPLVAVTGDDGINFCDMRVIHGELPPMRYPGLYKVIGPQYVRGISEWSSDGSRADAATWLAYSVNKEDIWVSRVPLPTKGGAIGWNTYGPKWAPAAVAGEAAGSSTIVLEDRDPADYARAFLLLDGREKIDVTFSVEIQSPAGEALRVQLEGPRGQRALTMPLAGDGETFTVRIAGDCKRNAYSQWINENPVVMASPQPVERLERIVFTTGERPAPFAPENDQPTAPAKFRVTQFRIASDVSPAVTAQSTPALKFESFHRDPGWEEHSNRIVPAKALLVKQDFGYSTTQFAGQAAGEMGGVIQRATKPSSYAATLTPGKTLHDRLSASGSFAITKAASGAGVFFGFSNSQQPGGSGRPIGSLGLNMDFERTGGRLSVRLITGGNKSCGTFITPYLPGKFRPTPIKADGTRYHWTLDYDPEAAGGNGRFAFTMRSEGHTTQDYGSLPDLHEKEAQACFPNTTTFNVDLPPGYKTEGATFDRFGVSNGMKSGGAVTLFFDDLRYNGEAQDFSQDPGWVGGGNRVTFEDREVTGAHDFGYSAKTNHAGGAAGEVGGGLWRSGDFGYYADRVGPLNLEQRLEAHGKVKLVTAGPDSDMSLGWFNSAAREKGTGDTENFVGIHVGGPTRIGHYFIPAFARATGAKAKVEKGPVLVPGKVFDWSLTYDPAGARGNGEMRATLGTESVSLALKPGQKAEGASFDRFGLFTSTAGGQMVKIYLDDLTYTVATP